MNEADRKAYLEWFDKPISSNYPESPARYSEIAWQAACEHKQQEIDRMKDRISALESTSVVRSLEVQRNALKSRVARLEGFAKDVHRWTVPDPYDERDAPPLQDRLRKSAWAVLQEVEDD